MRYTVHRDFGGKVSMAIFRCRKITIASVNGHAVGVGVTGFQLPFDFRFVWAGAKLALPFVRRGITAEGTRCRRPLFTFPLLIFSVTGAGASSYLLPRLIGHSKATALLLTGGTFAPDSPYVQGLYHEVLPSREAVFPAALALARELADNTSAPGIAATKALLWRGADSIEEQHLLDSRAIGELGRSADAAEGARAFKERRQVQFKDTVGGMGDWIPWVGSPIVSVVDMNLTGLFIVVHVGYKVPQDEAVRA
jgi:enoyl-CoA hydratase/carnithine racemase